MVRRSLGHYNNLKDKAVEQDGSSKAVRMEFARRLEQRRIAKGWNQSELARRAFEHLPTPAEGQKQGHSLGRDLINRYSRGKVLPAPERLEAIAKALGCKPSDLLPPESVSAVHDLPTFSMVATSSRHVFLRINRSVSMATATKITDLLNKEDKN